MIKVRLFHLLILASLFPLLSLPAVDAYKLGNSNTFADLESQKNLAMKIIENEIGINVSAYHMAVCRVYDGPDNNFRVISYKFYTSGVTSIGAKDTCATYIDIYFFKNIFNGFTVRHMRPRPLFFKKGFLNPSNPLKIATNFLEEYMELCNATHVQKLLDLLGRVKTTNENLTLWSPDNSIKLEISIEKLGGEAYWRAEFTSYVNVSNGLSVKIPFVGVSLTVSEKGYIQGFIDNMAVMEIGSTEINVSEDEAIRKALENEKIRADLEDVKQRFGLKIDRIETRLTFCERDVRTLHPSWEVKIYLNGCVINIDRHLYVVPKYNGTGWLVCAGFRASIWADTGEVYSTGVMALKGGSPPPEHTQNIIPLQFILIGCIITAITICIICKYRKCKVFPRLTKKS